MPTAAPDDLYWNPMDLDSDESMPYPNKQYIDPWDLENYAYIRQHLDSVDLSPDPSSLGEPQETSAFYYIPARPIELPPPPQPQPQMDDESIYYHHRTMGGERLEKIYDAQAPQQQYHQDAEYYYTMRQPATRYETIARSERQANYAAIDELLVRNEFATARRSHRRASHAGSIYGGSLPVQPPPQQYATYARRGSSRIPREDIYDQYNYEPTETDLYGIPENTTMQIYEKNKTLRRPQMSKNDGPVAKMAKSRSHSFSVGDHEHDPYRAHQSIYNDDHYVRSELYDSTGSSPIYDDIRSSLSHRPPTHFKVSNYGHLQIDYSLSWNNFNKYIYN